MSLRVVEIVTTLGVGGAEMHLLALTRALVQRGHRPEVVYLKGEGELAGAFADAGVPSRKIPMESARAAPRAIAALAAHLRSARPDVVHTHLLKADAIGALAAWRAGLSSRLVASKHNDERALLHPVVSRVHGLLSRLDRRVIVLSDHVGRFVAEHGRVPPAKIRRIYYGVDPSTFASASGDGVRRDLAIDDDEFVWICVARFAPQKAHEILLDAFARALAQAPRQRLLLVGDDPFGDHRAKAESKARELRLADQVRFLGIRRDVPRLLAASDGFVMASRWEGLGLVFLEAMAAGKPIVATGVSAVPEVVPDGVAGILVPPDDPITMSRALLAVARNPDRVKEFGDGGRRWVAERFGLERMVEEILAVYAEVTSRAPRP